MYCVQISEINSKKIECQPLLFSSIENAILGSFQFMKQIIPSLTLDIYKKNLVTHNEISYTIKLILDIYEFKICIVECINCTWQDKTQN